ncbi:MAG: hypothetical protein AB1Z98_04760, partial [Nannocystaceae bacterium]
AWGGSEDEDEDEDEDAPRSRKRRHSDDDDDDGSHASVALDVHNPLRYGPCSFRFGLWNIENLTGDVVRHGRSWTRNPIDSARNQVRLELIAQAIAALGLDGLAIMEMGSDAEVFLGRITGLLRELDGGDWNFTISQDTGPAREVPDAIELDLRAGGNFEQRRYCLEQLLPYYRLDHCADLQRTPRRLLDAHRLITQRLDYPGCDGLIDVLDALQADESTTLDVAATAIEEAVGPLHDQSMSFHHWHVTLNHHFRAPDIARLFRRAPAWVIALFLVYTSARLRLQRHAVPREDGPLSALRYFGYNQARYEKYGVLWRTGLHPRYLEHSLVRTSLREIGLPTNSRAALDFRLPLGDGRFFRAFLLHAMWTPDGGGRWSAEEQRRLRRRTVVTHAQRAADEPGSSRPGFLMFDSNVAERDRAELDRSMAEHGYQRLGDATQTTLRTEATLLGLGPGSRSDEMFNEPYDCIYQHRDLRGTYETGLEYPSASNRVLHDVFLGMLARNDTVRAWYFAILVQRYAPIWHRCHRGHPDEDATVLGTLRGHCSRASTDLVPGRSATAEFFRGLLANLGAMDLGTFRDARLRDLVALLLALRPDTERVYLLFHRHFISDHRLLVLALRYNALMIGSSAVKRSRRSVFDIDETVAAAGLRAGEADGSQLDCFLHSIHQLTNGEGTPSPPNLRAVMAFDGAAPRRGLVDAADPRLQSWVEHQYPGFVFHIMAQDTVDGSLVERATIGGPGGTDVYLLLHDGHFVPLW